MTLPSPVEIFKTLLEEEQAILDLCPGGVVVGPVPVERQRQGCVLLAQSGVARREIYLPVIRASVTMRAVAESIDLAERISSAVYASIHSEQRRVVRQPSLDQQFLVHFALVSSGPTLAVGENQEVWEHILLVESLIGTDPVV